MEKNREYVIEEISYGALPTAAENDENVSNEENKQNEILVCRIPSRIYGNSNTKSKIIKDGFGIYKNSQDDRNDGKVINRFTIVNSNDISVQITAYGATITSIKMPDKDGNFDDVVLGYENFEGYSSSRNPYFGATVGRITGIIPKYVFNIENDNYYVSNNFLNGHHANGGFIGFDKVLWNSYIRDDKLFLSYMSKDLEEGFPGDVLVNRSYELTSKNELIIKTIARCTKPTPVDISTHVDWNLSSHLGGPTELYNHYLMVNADRYAQVNSEQLATGKLKKVNETVLDFRIPRHLSKIIHKVPGGGYNHFMRLTRGSSNDVIFAAKLAHPNSGRYLEVLTDQPGVLVYTQNNLHAHPNLVLGHPITCWCHDPVSILQQQQEYIAALEESKKSEIPEESDFQPKSFQSQRSDNQPKSFQSQRSDNQPKSFQSQRSDNQPKSFQSQRSDNQPKSFQSQRSDNQPKSFQSQKAESDNQSQRSDHEKSFQSQISGNREKSFQSQTFDQPEEYGPIIGKGGAKYVRHGGIRIVPQNYPEPVARKKDYVNYILYPGNEYQNTTIYKFGVIIKKKPNLSEVVY
ncbi:uncharacterized protein LOC142319918 [Lycorma delicatula]|uniref:uncharacterized protein LOC142319918 n=1 Tax=Lycorma delicatula TaxID=130591 RepID=UPI003F513B0D